MSPKHMNENPKDSPVALALRSEGFKPLPRLWVPAHELDAILAITQKYRSQVNQIRARVYETDPQPADRRPVFHKNHLSEAETISANPIEDKEAAWAAYERAVQEGRI